jgi:hypothetical protein
LSRAFDRLKQARRELSGEGLPANANVKLLRCWNEVARGGVPVLIMRAPSRGAAGLKPRIGEFDYMAHILASGGENARVSVEFVEGANHSFSNRAGRTAVSRLMDVWLGATFTGISGTAANAAGENVIVMPSTRQGHGGVRTGLSTSAS